MNCAKILAAAGIRAAGYHFDCDDDPLVTALLADAGIPIDRF